MRSVITTHVSRHLSKALRAYKHIIYIHALMFMYKYMYGCVYLYATQNAPKCSFNFCYLLVSLLASTALKGTHMLLLFCYCNFSCFCWWRVSLVDQVLPRCCCTLLVSTVPTVVVNVIVFVLLQMTSFTWRSRYRHRKWSRRRVHRLNALMAKSLWLGGIFDDSEVIA